MLEVENPPRSWGRRESILSHEKKRKEKQKQKPLPQAFLIQETCPVWSVTPLLTTAEYEVVCWASNSALMREPSGVIFSSLNTICLDWWKEQRLSSQGPEMLINFISPSNLDRYLSFCLIFSFCKMVGMAVGDFLWDDL